MPTTHQLTVTLDEVQPPIWRRLLVPSHYTLSQVQRVLLTAMGWSGGHLGAFRVGGVFYQEPDEDWPDNAEDPASVRLVDLVGPGEVFVFEYDFGDGWEHQVVVEEVLPAAGRTRPVCLAGARACPPEDVGGPWGYADFLAAIADPGHDEHVEMLDWVGGAFDPEDFDPAAVDRLFAADPDVPG
jgi:hypothetical protein